ncbi:UDP-N-acetylglucosamine 2-epimerase (non-hydrolyzing) [Fulvivirgaceae bacterium BMA10]|uniref:UDP-N-acetylglucosamine 2-epimerase (non-hydrolyzing) n=1 Tax=Splendidivirga corallicola TaxID=3051826 RepID=A0ABT8KZV8_9BACT|nr:UDP-N-acetylglucosamine 2-epimerase (non-hydrolyzing) [Fulvivirgaceae bacterium BMA10]
MNYNVAIVVGTRPEAIKLLPVLLEMKKSKVLSPILISTGQHKEMLDQIFNLFDVTPDITLDVMTSGQTLASLTSILVKKLDETIVVGNFDCLIVQGDTTTAFCAGLVAYYHQIKVAHVEAGLRTHDIYSPFPEEVNRKLISTFCNLNFAPTQKAVEALEAENVKNIHCVGNTVIDSLLMCLNIVNEKKEQYIQYDELTAGNEGVVLITGHRRESFGEDFINICTAIQKLATKYQHFCFVYPVHLNPKVQGVVKEMLSDISNVKLIEPIPYDELVYLMSRSTIILTDSGGIQEEAPSLDIPVIVMRNRTEREEGIEAGCSVLSGTSTSGIVEAFVKIMEDTTLYETMSRVANPYGDGKTSERIVEILESM